MARKYKTEKCDHIVKIAEENKYYKWQTVWDGNKELQNSRDRSNPLVLFTGDKQWEGDEIELPAKGPPPFKQSIDKAGVYKVPKVVKLCLRLRILKSDFSPAKDASFELIVKDGKTYKGKTDDKGFVKKDGKDPEIPKTCTEATLSIRLKAEGGDDDKDIKGDDQVNWKLQIGRLNPLLEKAHTKYCISGVQQRLNNLGFYSGPVDGIKGANTKLAIEKFQSLFGLKVDNIPGTGETQPKLKEVHDTDKTVTVPDGDKEPTKTIVPKNRFRPTTAEDMGHVAPDFTDSKEPFVNTFVLKPEYRISLKLGEIENLFPWGINTKAGRLARLQVLGLFYWPLNHRVAAGLTTKLTSLGFPANYLGPPAPGDLAARNRYLARFADNAAAYDFIWDYFLQKFCGGGNDNAGEDELKKRLKEWVVQKFAAAAHGAGGELPVAVDTDEQGEPSAAADRAQGHFAKIRLPGGWCFLHHDNFAHNRDSSINGMEMYDRKYDFEGASYTANPVLGKIPLVAKVEKRKPSKDEWEPAPDVQVYFQILRPYDLPDFNATANQLNTQPNRPPLREGGYSSTHPNPPTRPHAGPPVVARSGGPKYFGRKWLNYNINHENPLANNCHEDCGGKRKSGNPLDGSDVNNILFKLGEVDGFSKVHGNPPAGIDAEGNPARVLDPAPPFKAVEASGENTHPHAVKTLTNASGEAGVIFMPSRCAGDRYRIRAYVRPATAEGPSTDPGSDGKGMNAVRVDTGTFVTWRNIRISRYVRQQLTQANLNSVMVNQRYGRADNAAIGANDRRNWMKRFRAVNNANNWVGLPDYDMNTVSGGDVGDEFDGFRTALARAFCEFEEDPGFATENLTQAEWNAAVTCGLDDLKQVGFAAAGPYALPAAVRAAFGPPNNRIDHLFFREAGNTDGITVSNGFLFPARTSAAFDASTGTNMLTGPNRAIWKRWIHKIFYYGGYGFLLGGFMRHVAKNGYLPGMTFVQSVMVSNLGREAGYSLAFSGLATMYHGAYVVYGAHAYPARIANAAGLSYSYTANATHEMGHVLFSVHAPGHDGTQARTAGGVRTEWHDCHGMLVDNTNTVTAAVANDRPVGNPSHGTCLMSYRDCEGQFCTRCLAQFQGWDSRSAQMRAGDAALPPMLEPLKWQRVKEGQEITVNLRAKAMRGLAVAITCNNLPAGAVLTDNGDGTAEFKWTPAGGTAETYSMLFTATEGVAPQTVQTENGVLVITVLA
ncbi:MAG: peptidoglycan-binding protein [Desulfobulbaceae bacterium]|nr:peptidoglycan-binding protein [Desulfobulbaceae bacterium]